LSRPKMRSLRDLHGSARRSRLPGACVFLAAAALAWRLSSTAAWVGSRPAESSRQHGRVALHADNLFDRFVRVAKSNVNKVISGLEDPEKVLDQAVEEMQSDLIKVRQSYAEVLATQRRIQTQKDQQDEVAAEWYRRAELAIEKGDDSLAKEALTRRQSAVQKGEDLGSQLASMSGNVDKLFDSVKALEDKIVKAKDEKEQLIARARTAKTTASVNEMLSDVGSSSGAGAFDRMKEKVESLETRAEVSAGLLPEGEREGSLEDRFKQLEAGNAVDDELAMLKGKKALPPSGGSTGGDALDKELEAMRKKLKES